MISTKQELRRWAKTQGGLREEKSSLLVSKLKNLEEYQKAKNIMLFYPMKNEVNLLALLDDKTKNFFLPKVSGAELLCCPYSKGDRLCLSCFKTKEPYTEAEDKNKTDLVIVPALCCDRNNYRLGYGGGFYDRFLKDFKGTTLVCIPEELIVETVYPEKHDIPVDFVITA